MNAIPRRVALIAALATLIVLAAPRGARGAPGSATPASPVSLTAAPLLGSSAPLGGGWFQIDVRLRSLVDEPVEGEVELESELTYSRDRGSATTRAPFSLPPRGTISLRLPTHGFGTFTPAVTAVARTRDGAELARFELTTPPGTNPALFVLSVPNRLGAWLRDARLQLSGRRLSGGYGETEQLFLATASVEAGSGELVVPELAAGYAAATVVLVTSTQLARLGARAHQALADWVLAGGTVAVAVDRPEDLRLPLLRTLVGGELERTAAEAGLSRERIFEVVPESDPDRGVIERTARPSATVTETFAGFTGGNLHPSPWGTSASYGLGELHLLAFDPTREPAASDPWVHLGLLELVRHAWDRKIHVVLPHGEVTNDSNEARAIRRLVDPNERTRWAIAVAALLLLAYSMLAGPLNFYLAARRGQPLRALWHLPLWSLGTLASVVALGVLAKGIHGQVRHLTLIEAGAGMGRGATVRFRGFYAPSARELVVRAQADGNVLDVLDATSDTERVLVVDRDGPRLERFRAKPWQTVLVREDGFVPLAGGVALAVVDGKVVIKNRLGRHLVGVLVNVGDGRTFHFPRLEDGATVTAESGEPLGNVGIPTGLGTLRLDAAALSEKLEADDAGLGAAWSALETFAHADTDWWPVGTPVLIGQVVGGEGASRDSGLALVQDRVLVRVVGVGGEP